MRAEIYRCACCGAIFYEPNVRKVRENLDGENGIWLDRIESCPNCGSEDFDECETEDKQNESEDYL